MEKLATVLVILLLAVIGSCMELIGSEYSRANRVEGSESEQMGNRIAAEPTQAKAKLLPVKVVSEGGEKKSTEDILRHIGMSKVRSQANNHRKRLASQSRKSHNEKHLADSHVFVIKLPPNRYYYEQDHPKGHYKSADINRIPLDFKSNGKPGKIYHWNLPLVKKMVARKTGNVKLAKEHDANQVLKSGPIWPKDEEQPLQYRRVTYYKPKKPSKQAFHKFFPGNGKPHSLYVIERSKRPARVVT